MSSARCVTIAQSSLSALDRRSALPPSSGRRLLYIPTLSSTKIKPFFLNTHSSAVTSELSAHVGRTTSMWHTHLLAHSKSLSADSSSSIQSLIGQTSLLQTLPSHTVESVLHTVDKVTSIGHNLSKKRMFTLVSLPPALSSLIHSINYWLFGYETVVLASSLFPWVTTQISQVSIVWSLLKSLIRLEGLKLNEIIHTKHIYF